MEPFLDLSDEQLSSRIKSLEWEAGKLSYRRRLLHGEIDILAAHDGRLPQRVRLSRLKTALQSSGATVVSRTMCLGDCQELEVLLLEERELSRRRRVLHALIDILREERVRRLQRRYRQTGDDPG